MKKNITLILSLIIMGASYLPAHAVEKSQDAHILDIVSFQLNDESTDQDYTKIAEEFCQKYNYSAEGLEEHFISLMGQHPQLSNKINKLYTSISDLIVKKQEEDLARADEEQLNAAMAESMKTHNEDEAKRKREQDAAAEINQQKADQLAAQIKAQEDQLAAKKNSEEESKTAPNAKPTDAFDALMDLKPVEPNAKNIHNTNDVNPFANVKLTTAAKNTQNTTEDNSNNNPFGVKLKSAETNPKNTQSNTEDNSNNNPFGVKLKSAETASTELKKETNDKPLFGNALIKNPVKQSSKEDLEKQQKQAEDELDQARESRDKEKVKTLSQKIKDLQIQIDRLGRL